MAGRLARKVAVLAAAVLAIGFAGCVVPPLVLHGSITDAGTGDAVPGVAVRVYSSASETVVAETVADGTGTYRFYGNELPDGSYRVRFGEAEWHEGASSWIDAAPVTVTSSTRTRVDAAVVPELGELTGTVSNGTTPLVSVGVEAFSTVSGGSIASTSTDETGTYTFEGLAAGEYWVRAGAEGFASAYLGGTTTRVGATEITVDQGATTTVGDIVLSPANRLDLRLLDAAVDGEPVAGIVVLALIDGSLAEPLVLNASGTNGIVQLLPLATDTYYFVLYDPSGTYPLRLVNDGGTPVAFPVGSAGDFQQLDIDLSTGQIIPEPTATSAQIAVGSNFSCVLDADGAVGCWGRDQDGLQHVPDVPLTTIDAMDRHICGLTDAGKVECWGNNDSGQTDSPPGTFAAVVAGGTHSCALDPAGEVTCWGYADYGVLDEPDGPFESIEAGLFHACGLRASGAAECWGLNANGQPMTAPPGAFTDLTGAAYHSCGVTITGTAACWGLSGGRTMPLPGTGDYESVSSGTGFTCALTTTGTIVCGGNNAGGQTDAPAGTFAAVDSTGSHSCAITVDGHVACWGIDAGGIDVPTGSFVQVALAEFAVCGLRVSGNVDCRTPSAVPTSGHTFGLIGGNDATGCGLLADGQLECWGSNSSGQATPPPGTFSTFSFNGYHGCALDGAGAVSCWGADTAGQASPPPGTFASVSAGAQHTCGVATDASVVCWGSDTWGQASPIAGEYTSVAAGGGHTCAVTTDQDIACWGADNWGQLSPPAGDYVAVSTGTATTCGLTVDGSAACVGQPNFGATDAPPGPFTSISAGAVTTCGLRADGSYRCWGRDMVTTWIDG